MYRNSSQVWTENGVTYDLQSPSILSDHPKCKLGHWNIWEQLRYIYIYINQFQTFAAKCSLALVSRFLSGAEQPPCWQDCFFFETIRIPFNPRPLSGVSKSHCPQGGWDTLLVVLPGSSCLLHVDIFEVQVPLQMEFEDEWVGRPFVLGTVLWVAASNNDGRCCSV